MPRLPDATAVSIPSPRRQLSLPQDQAGAILGQTFGNLAGSLQGAADQIRAYDVNLTRAKAANALLDHEIAVKGVTDDIQQKIQSGELDYAKAGEAYNEALSKLPQSNFENADPVTLENFNRGQQRLNFGGQQAIGKIVDTAKRQDFKGQFEANLDKLGKLAGMPGANIEDINQKAGQFAPLAMAAGIPKDQVEAAVQNFKDRNWLNDATQRAMEAKDSIPKLKQLEHDLTSADGFYSGKLDTDKRNAVLRSVINDRLVIENRLEHLKDRREALAQRALNQFTQQIDSGIPATADMRANWANTVKGTEAEADFKQLLNDEQEVQDVLRKPIDQQLKYVQDKQATLTSGGGTLRQKANINRLDNAVKANVTQLQTAPLLFNANRTGEQPQALDDLTSADASKELASRVATLTAMRKQYGGMVQMRPLLPQEAQQLSSDLAKSTPQEQSEMLADLRKSVGDTQAFMGAMQQIAPDSPVRALAGMIGAKQAQITNTHMFSANDVATSGDVATTLLQGEQILNQSKSQKAEDGKPKTGLYLPNDDELQADFQAKVGKAFANRPQAAETAYQAVKSYYVGKAAQNGRLASSKQDVDGNLVKEAIDSTLGSVINYNGGGEVFAPWGMDRSTFDDRAQAILGKVVGKISGDVGLKNAGENTYYVTHGKNFVTDAQGRPIVIDITTPIPVTKRVSRGRGAQEITEMQGWP